MEMSGLVINQQKKREDEMGAPPYWESDHPHNRAILGL